MPKYPAQIDNSQSLPTAIDNLTPVQGSIFNKLRDAVLAVESELGVKPSGSYTTVRSRLDTLEGIVGNLLIIELHKDLGGTLEEPLVIGIQGRPVSTVPPTLGQVLAWNGIAWIPSTGAGGGGGFDPPLASSPGQTLVWDGSAYIPNFILGDDVIPPYDQTLTSAINLVEVGQTVSSPAFTATYEIPPTSSSITDDEFSTPTDVSSSPSSFISPFNYTKSAYGDIVTFTLTAVQGHVTKTVDYQIEWAQKAYYGVASAGQTGEVFIKSLAGQPVTNTKNISFAINAGATQKIYYACRSAYGDMVFTIHDTEGGFTKTQSGVNITNDFGFTEGYDLYESDYAGLGILNVFVGDGDDFFQSGGGPIGPQGPTGPGGAIVFDLGFPAENLRSIRTTSQSPIDNGYSGQNNFSSAVDIGDGYLPANLVTSGTSGNFTTILSGNFNEAKSGYSVITGGMGNRILNNTQFPTFSFIGAGKDNTINETSGLESSNIIGGGTSNTILAGSYNVSIVGGDTNSSGGSRSSIMGGNSNEILNGASSVIVGGTDNTLATSADYCGIIGGLTNTITDADHSAIISGSLNVVEGNNSVIVGGHSNDILKFTSGFSYSAIVAGASNLIHGSFNSFVAGGFNNQIISTPSGGCDFAAIVGGQDNTVESNQSAIIGGFSNAIAVNSLNSAIVGGFNNQVNSNYIGILGGLNNVASANYSVILGGQENQTFGTNSVSMGHFAQTIRYGQVAHSSVGTIFSAITPSQYSIYSVAGTSSNGVSVELTDFGSAQLNLENNKAYLITAYCVANRDNSANRSAFTHSFLAHSTAGVAVIDGSVDNIFSKPNGNAWTIAYTTSGSDIVATFTGTIGQNVNAMVTYHICEIS